MERSAKRIAILTSDGDRPGLNAVIQSVVKTAILRHEFGSGSNKC
jgi:6-phosphofructokinase